MLAVVALLPAVEDAETPQDRPAPVLRGFIPYTEVENDDTAVAVDGFKLLPLGRLEAGGRAWEFHPKALAGIALDSNPLMSPDQADSDLQTRVGLGFELRGIGRAGWSGGIDAMLRHQRYAETTGRDFTGGDAKAQAVRTSQTGRFAATGSWERSAEPVIDLPQQLERERFAAKAALSSETRGSRLQLEAGWDRLDYLEDGPGFDRDARDYQRWSAKGSWSLIGALDSLLGLELAGESVSRPPASTANPYDGITLGGRWRHALGRRLASDLRLGACLQAYADDTLGVSANDDRVLLSPAFDARLIWAVDERSTAVLGISHRLAEGVTASANASEMTALEASLRLRLLDRLDAVGTLWYAHRVDSAPTGPSGTEQLDDAFVRGGLDYRLSNGLGVRLWTSWQNHEAAISSDYRRSMVGLELVAAL